MPVPDSYRVQDNRRCATCDHGQILNSRLYCRRGELNVMKVALSTTADKTYEQLAPTRVDTNGLCDEWTELPPE